MFVTSNCMLNRRFSSQHCHYPPIELFTGEREWQKMLHGCGKSALYSMGEYTKVLEMDFFTRVKVVRFISNFVTTGSLNYKISLV